MVDMKICFVGIGSIAKRHIFNIKNHLSDESINFIIDAFRSSNAPLNKSIRDYIDNEFFDLNDVPNNYDAIFITNPTKYHYDTLKSFSTKSNNFFIEKPIVDINDVNNDFTFLQDKICYIACPIRHSILIKYLKKNINFDNVNAVRCICSSYLPDWRPNQDYSKSYSANKNLGGGVSIDLIHEWDYLVYLLGMPKQVFNIMSKVSNLKINTEDVAIYIGLYEDKVIELHLDYFGRFPMREIEFFTNEDTIVADIQNNKLYFKNSNDEIDFNQERNDFQVEELKYFFNLINNKIDNMNKIDDALKIMKLTQGDCL